MSDFFVSICPTETNKRLLLLLVFHLIRIEKLHFIL